MQHSESLVKLAAALARAQGEMENAAKSSDNPFFRSKYADLAEIINTCRPVMARHGLSVVQLPGFEGDRVTLENVLLHESGEWMAGLSAAPMPVMTTRDGRELPPSPQGVGSAITYLRRYSLAAVCMIAQEDDDAEAATAPTRNPEHTPAKRSEPTKPTEPVGVKNGNVFDLDAKAPGKKANGRSWRELLKNEEGRGFVDWAIKNMSTLDFAAKETLTLALAAARLGDPDFSGDLGVEPLPAEVGR